MSGAASSARNFRPGTAHASDPLDWSLALLLGKRNRAGRFGPRGGYRITHDEMERMIARLTAAKAQGEAARHAITVMEEGTGR